MTIFRFLTAAAVIGGVAAAPAAAQYYPQQYPQQYPPQYQPQYPQAYPGYQQGAQNPIAQIVDQLLGNRYNVTDRTKVQQCATAAVAQASAQYRPRYSQGYNQGYAQPYGGYGHNNAAAMMRVTAITNVERRSNGLRVSGMINSGMHRAYSPYGGQYANQAYANAGDLSFRCNVDYRGAVTDIRVRRATTTYRR